MKKGPVGFLAGCLSTLFPWVTSLLLAACAVTPQPADVESRKPTPPAARTPDSRPAVPAPSATTQPPVVTKKGGGYYKDDGPGDTPPADMASIPDAEPKVEPLHRFANRPYAALGQNYVPKQALTPYRESGIASWYGRRFHGARTSSGERYDMYGMTAAHPTLPIPSYVRVTSVENGKSVIVRINDRGPFHSDRVIDLSYTVAWKLGYVTKGSTRVEVESIVPEGVSVVGAKPATTAAAAVVAKEALVMPVIESPEVVPGLLLSVTPAPLPATAPELTTAPPGVYLQLGSFNSNRNAEGFRDYAKQELGTLKQQLFILEEGERFRLHLGPFANPLAAREMAERIANKLKLKPFVVQR